MRLWIVAVVAVLGLPVFAGCANRTVADQAPGGVDFVTQAHTVTGVIPLSRRPAAPALSGPAVQGGQVDLAALHGQVVLLNVWASWCAPCRAETPGLVAVYRQTHTQGAAFLGINIRDSQDAAMAFIRDYHVPYPSLYDPAAGRLARFRSLPPTTIPSTLVVDRHGRVAARFINAVDPDELQPLLAQLLAEPRT